MAEAEKGFPAELQEVVFDVTREFWHRLPDMPERAKAFFYKLADLHSISALDPQVNRDDEIATVLMMVFLAGREHALRGYKTPVVREEVPEEIDDMPDDLEDEIERMYGSSDE